MNYADDRELPEVTDEQLEEALPTTRPYTIVVLRAGARFQPPGADRDPDVEKVIWAHGKRNFALRLAGLMPIVCPVADGSGVTGVSIFDATPEDVDRIMSVDPGVQAGVFTWVAVILLWFGFRQRLCFPCPKSHETLLGWQTGPVGMSRRWIRES